MAGISIAPTFENRPMARIAPEEYAEFVDPINDQSRNGVPNDVPDTDRVLILGQYGIASGGCCTCGRTCRLYLSGVISWGNPFPTSTSPYTSPHLYRHISEVNDDPARGFFGLENWKQTYQEVREMYPEFYIPAGLALTIGGLKYFPDDTIAPMLSRIKKWLDTFAKSLINDAEMARLKKQESDIDSQRLQIELKIQELERRNSDITTTLRSIDENGVRVARRSVFVEMEQTHLKEREEQHARATKRFLKLKKKLEQKEAELGEKEEDLEQKELELEEREARFKESQRLFEMKKQLAQREADLDQKEMRLVSRTVDSMERQFKK